METSPEVDFELLDALVRRIFYIEDITIGHDERDYVVRYHGRLLAADSAGAHAQLAEWLSPYGLTPLFRWDDGRQAVYLVRGVPTTIKPANPAVNVYTATITMPMSAATPVQFFSRVTNPTLRAELRMKQELPYVAIN